MHENTFSDHIPATNPSASETQEMLQGYYLVHAVGDLDGSYTKMMRILETEEIIDESGKWCAKNRHVVFHGDILMDR